MEPKTRPLRKKISRIADLEVYLTSLKSRHRRGIRILQGRDLNAFRKAQRIIGKSPTDLLHLFARTRDGAQKIARAIHQRFRFRLVREFGDDAGLEIMIYRPDGLLKRVARELWLSSPLRRLFFMLTTLSLVVLVLKYALFVMLPDTYESLRQMGETQLAFRKALELELRRRLYDVELEATSQLLGHSHTFRSVAVSDTMAQIRMERYLSGEYDIDDGQVKALNSLAKQMNRLMSETWISAWSIELRGLADSVPVLRPLKVPPGFHQRIEYWATSNEIEVPKTLIVTESTGIVDNRTLALVRAQTVSDFLKNIELMKEPVIRVSDGTSGASAEKRGVDMVIRMDFHPSIGSVISALVVGLVRNIESIDWPSLQKIAFTVISYA